VIDVGQAESLALDTRAIDAELARLWAGVAEGSGGGLVRAFSLTILALALDQEVGRVDAVLSDIQSAHPSRVLVVAPNETEPRARLGAHCRPPRAGRAVVCWEEVRLEGQRAKLNLILSAVASLVLPNLPVQAWWPGDPDFAGHVFRRVVEIADCIIVDSMQFANPVASMAGYAERVEEEHSTVGFADLNWRRFEPWRLLTAQFFDNPADRPFLNDLESVLVKYQPPLEGQAGGFAAALLLVGWLASRLGWAPPVAAIEGRQHPQELLFDDGARGVRVSLQPCAMDPSLAQKRTFGLISLELRATHNGQRASYSIEWAGENATTVARVDDASRETQVPLHAPSEADLLQRELARFGRDRIYEDALLAVRSLALPLATHSPLQSRPP
jgi:glucose-6-phosphate dehydrogenase assembly protein OpcA